MKNNTANILFLCTGNSARSVLAEALLNQFGKPGFRGFSTGSKPKGTIHPGAIQVLDRNGVSTDNLSSKSWDDFARTTAPALDVVITVCDNAAAEVCPVWPAHPMKVHWSITDPAAVEGAENEISMAFDNTYSTVKRCILNLIETMQNEDNSGKVLEQLNSLNPSKATKPGRSR